MPKAFDPNNLPKGFPPDGLMRQHGKPYITHVGLVWLANHRGKPWNGTIVSHEIKWNQNGHPHAAVVVFKVWDDEQEHTDIGDAATSNVGKMIAPHLIRMASTRAQNRALRAFVGYAGCTADELQLGEAYQEPSAAPREQPRVDAKPASQNSNRGQSRSVQSVKTNCDAKCPACGGSVWDNRERAIKAREESGKRTGPPYFKCSRGAACPGGKGDYAWGEFNDPDWLLKQQANRQSVDLAFSEDSVAGSIIDSHAVDENGNPCALPEGPPTPDDDMLPF